MGIGGKVVGVLIGLPLLEVEAKTVLNIVKPLVARLVTIFFLGRSVANNAEVAGLESLVDNLRLHLAERGVDSVVKGIVVGSQQHLAVRKESLDCVGCERAVLLLSADVLENVLTRVVLV